ncbi:MAG: hypothetical protein LLG00_07080 [Planctomycetaceae bacterium]|nr:hypothetical protein [Planctomycetaceae bacterium]
MLIHCVLLTLSLAGSTPQAERNLPPVADNGQLRARVQRLVRQLDAARLAERDAAEAELTKAGPAILDLLPAGTERMSAEVQERLARVRERLQRQAADAAAQSSTITLRDDAMPLSKVLAAFRQQSGNAITDNREKMGQLLTDPPIKAKFDKTPFWPALDQVLDQAGLTLYPFAEQAGLSVTAAPSGVTPRIGKACYAGPFRIEAVDVVGRRELRQASQQSLMVGVEVAWEPRLRMISVGQRLADLSATDERGQSLAIADRQAVVESPISGDAPAVKLDMPLRLPPRSVDRIASLKGKLTAVIPGKIETFRFDKLAGAKNVEKRIAGVTVTLEEVGKNNDAWEVRLKVRFDEAGDALASHLNWIFTNPAFLEGQDGKPVAYDTFETTAQEKNELGIAYLFNVDKPLDQFAFVYKTPGAIVRSQFPYELKDVKLP